MPVKITDVKFKNELRNEATNWLLANVGDKITIELEFKVETSVIANSDDTHVFNHQDGFIATGGEYITDRGSRFTDIKVGDTITCSQYNPTVFKFTDTVIEKIDDSTIRIAGTTGYAANSERADTVISVTTPITAVKYKYNFIENDEQTNFYSKVDGTEQMLVAETVDASVLTPSAMAFAGVKPYQIGSATIQGAGITSSPVYFSTFKIIHNTFITPFLLTQQQSNIESLTAPEYYFNEKCLKAVFDVQAAYEYTDPNYLQTVEESSVIGNTGWFNENFNTGVTNYSVSNVVYKDPLLNTISAIELNSNITAFECLINNTTSLPFSNLNTKFTLNFCRIPANESEYQGNTKTLLQNFIFDRKFQTVGSAASNGDNFGTSYQVLTNVRGTFINASQIKIEFDANMVSNVISTIQADDEHRYIIWLAIQNHTLTTDEADKVSLLLDSQLFYENTTDATMVDITNSFLRHPFTNVDTESNTTIDMFPEDEVVGYSRFYLDRTGRLTDTIAFKSVEVILKAKNTSTLEEFTLESYKFDMTNLPFINNNQYVDFTLARQFHIPNSEIRKNIVLKRRTDLDTANFFYYDLTYPYLHRWEYWEKLAGVAGAFFDVSEPNNGFNHEWHRYTTLANWDFFYVCRVKATKNGAIQTYTEETNIGSNDYDTNPDWEPDRIRAFDNVTNVLLFDGATKNFILGYKDTRIEAEFTKISLPPLLSNLKMVIGIEVYEEGGIDGRRRISSVFDIDSDTWFKSVDTSNKVKLTLTGSTIKGECLVDFTKIPLNSKIFKITARLYDLTPIASDKIFQDGNEFLFQDGNNYEFQDQ